MSNHGNPHRAAWVAHLRKTNGGIRAAYDADVELWVAWMRSEGYSTQQIAAIENALFKVGNRAACLSV